MFQIMTSTSDQPSSGATQIRSASTDPRRVPVDLTVLISVGARGNLAGQLTTLLRRLAIELRDLLLLRRPRGQHRLSNGHRRRKWWYRRGYGAALTTGFAHASGDYLLTMDADLSHPPEFVERAVAHGREQADVTIASRYVPGGGADMGVYRYALSRDPECRVLARARRADPRPVERVSLVPHAP